jgi:UPF0716 protein FxsA
VPLLVLILIAGVVELGVLVAIGQAIGVLPTIGLLLVAAVLGTWLLRHEGRRTVRAFQESVLQRRPPEREMTDGVLIAAGGFLIVLPGFVSDIAGLLLLLPPIRAVLRDRMLRRAEQRAAQAGERGFPHARGARFAGGDVIDGEVVSVTEDDEDAPVAPQLPRQTGPQQERSGLD